MALKLPVISGKKLVEILERNGFTQVRQKGSHVSMEKVTAKKTWRTVVPLHRELAKGTLMDILRQSGLTKEALEK